MTNLSTNVPTENDSLYWRVRVAQLETIVCELLMKNQQLRTALRSAGEELLLDMTQLRLPDRALSNAQFVGSTDRQ